MSFISLWAGDINPPDSLPSHLTKLYKALGYSSFQRDPEVCAEWELVPVGELLEPFSLPEPFFEEARKAAVQQSLRLANTVVAVYTDQPPSPEAVQVADCGLRFVGTFPE